MSTARKKKHSKTEIAAKLVHADNSARQGALQREIARTLGVSAMTLHRWRKLPLDLSATSSKPDAVAQFEEELGSRKRLAELELENSRLRRRVTDLLLEKVKIEETAQINNPPRPGSKSRQPR
jgi:putative transposase